VATALGVGFLTLAFRGILHDLRPATRFDGSRWARRVFAYSIPYLCILLVALLLDRRP
jgi:heme O synthase-like polyprenyltransferase